MATAVNVLETHVNIMLFVRLDTGMDHRVNKEEFTSPKMKETIEKVKHVTFKCNVVHLAILVQWVGPVEDMGAEFDKIDKNGGGQILFGEFVDWALEKDLDIEDDVEPQDL